MMDSALLGAALVGTGKQQFPCRSEDPIDRIVSQRAQDLPEQQLLMRGGMQSIFQAAGAVSQPVPQIDPAPDDPGITASPRLVSLLAAVFSAQAIPLLPEFLRILQRSAISFPPQLLPVALDCEEPSRREQLRHVLGPRGRWLAQFNPRWIWVMEETSSAVAADKVRHLQTILEEGTSAERMVALRQLRQLDSDAGRNALQMLISSEKGDKKLKLLETMSIRLSQSDEEFLESLRHERSKKVRDAACNLLVRIPGSQLSVRMHNRAIEVLQLVSTGTGQNRLECHLPAEIPGDWERDGIAAPPLEGIGPRAWWTRELLRRVPPAFWERHFQRTPAELLQGLEFSDDAEEIRQSWLDAAATFGRIDPATSAWFQPLWESGVRQLARMSAPEPNLQRSLTSLAHALPQEVLDQLLCDGLQQTADPGSIPFDVWLTGLASPWSKELSEIYLRITRRLFQSRCDAVAARWCQTLLPAALGLARESFSQALEPWSVNSDRLGTGNMSDLPDLLRHFGEVIRTREEFDAEVSKCLNRITPA